MNQLAEPIADGALDTIRRHIVQTALRLGEEAGSWDAVHVHEVAREAGISVEQLGRYFHDKDSIAEGYFDMADAALLATGNDPNWDGLDIRERVHQAIMAWLDSLAPHRDLVSGMLGYKLHPEHIHLQVRGIMRISRTVQWIREVCRLPSVGWRRELEEATLTTIYLATFSCWLTDKTPGSQRTRRLLERLLFTAEQGALWLGLPKRLRGSAAR